MSKSLLWWLLWLSYLCLSRLWRPLHCHCRHEWAYHQLWLAPPQMFLFLAKTSFSSCASSFLGISLNFVQLIVACLFVRHHCHHCLHPWDLLNLGMNACVNADRSLSCEHSTDHAFLACTLGWLSLDLLSFYPLILTAPLCEPYLSHYFANADAVWVWSLHHLMRRCVSPMLVITYIKLLQKCLCCSCCQLSLSLSSHKTLLTSQLWGYAIALALLACHCHQRALQPFLIQLDPCLHHRCDCWFFDMFYNLKQLHGSSFHYVIVNKALFTTALFTFDLHYYSCSESVYCLHKFLPEKMIKLISRPSI